MTNISKALQGKLNALRDEFINQLDERMQTIQIELDKYIKNDSSNDLHRLVHSLAGTSATYNLNTISDITKKMELEIGDAEKNNSRVSQQDLEQFITDVTNEILVAKE